MRRRMTTTLATMIAISLGSAAPAALHAQRPLTLGLGGGVSFPQGRLRDATGTGWHALGTLALGSPMQPMGLRLDGAYGRFAIDVPGSASASGDTEVGSLTLDLTYRLPMTNAPLSPYVITGAGAYRLSCTGDASCGSTTRFGWNAGLGVRWVAFRLHGFAESRFHSASTRGGSTRYVPVTLGVTL